MEPGKYVLDWTLVAISDAVDSSSEGLQIMLCGAQSLTELTKRLKKSENLGVW